MNVKDIEIGKIKQLENIRLRIEDEDVHTLMASIKQDGLLEPVGVATTPGSKDEYLIVYGNRRLEACRKLGWKTIPAIINGSIHLKDFVIKNTLENVERKEITESELGRIFTLLKNDYNMTNSEIASRFGVPSIRVKRVIDIFMHIPKEYRDKVKYGILGYSKKGNIPATAADAILGLRRRYKLKREQMNDLLEAARQDGFSSGNLEVVGSLMQQGYTVEEAIKLSKEYVIVNLKFPILKGEQKKLTKKYKMPFRQLSCEILRGNIKGTINIPEYKVNH